MITKNRLILIDGNSMLSSAFFGALDKSWFKGDKETAREKMMKTNDGQYTNAILGMTKTLLKLFKEQPSSHIAVAWDVSRQTHRRERYADYKAHRTDTASELGSQFKPMQELLDAMGIKQYRVEGWEADDIIGTLAKRFETEIPIVIITKDQDALQLVSENTRVWLNTSTAKEKISQYFGENFNQKTYNVPNNYFEFSPETFPHFYGGLKPIQIIDLKALEGDTSDNIPGVKGCGETSIYPLLNEFGTVEAIYDYIENTPEKDIKEFFKVLGITRSPLGSLLKKSNEEIANEAVSLLEKEFDKKLLTETKELFKTVDDKKIKEESKTLSKLSEEEFKETVKRLAEELRKIECGIVGKEAAFLSKELATIVTNMPQFNETELSELKFILNEDAMYDKFRDLEFNSLIKE